MDESTSSAVPADLLDLTVRLASSLVRPCDTLNPAGLGFGPLSSTELRALSADGAFARPVAHALMTRSPDLVPDISLQGMTSLATRTGGRLAVAFVSAGFADLEEAALLYTAAAMQRHVIALAGKRDRQLIRAALGPDAYELATQEAPVLYKALSALGDAGRFDHAMAAADAGETRSRLISFGMELLESFVALAAPELAPLMAARLPAGSDGRRAAIEPARLDRSQFLKLGNRRLRRWSAITV